MMRNLIITTALLFILMQALCAADSVTVDGTNTTVVNLKVGSSGATVNELSTDGTMAGDSNTALPTEKAVKAYVDAQILARCPKLIESKTVSTSTATLDFTSNLNETYKTYELRFISLQCGTSNTSLKVRASTDGGSTWASGSTAYKFIRHGRDTDGTAYNVSNANADNIQITNANLASGVAGDGAGICGTVRFYNIGITSERPRFEGQLVYKGQGNGKIVFMNVAGQRNNLEDIDALRVYLSSGNFTAGTVEIWGIP